MIMDSGGVILWIILFIRTLTSIEAAVGNNGSLSDAYHLLAFKQEMWEDPQDSMGDWAVDPTLAHACFWNGVQCADLITYRVWKLDLSQAGLVGPISGALGGLQQLSILNLSSNSLIGQIPSTLSTTNLSALDLRYNQLQYTIPTALGILPYLSKVYLSFNNLVGPLSFPAGLLQLQAISVESNQMTGYPLTSLMGIPTLSYVNLKSNLFGGVIDNAELLTFAATNVKQLLLGSNRFTGPLPTTSMARLTALRVIDFSNNTFSSTVPAQLFTSLQLVAIDLSRNIMTGPIPAVINKLTNLRRLHIQYNGFTGVILTNILPCTKLADIRIDSNSLTGTIPTGFAALTHLRNFNLSTNQLTGPIPSDLALLKHLELLDLSSNLLNGGLPQAIITGCVGLVSINVSFNPLGGTLPTGFELLKNLQEVRLAGCNFTGTLPVSLGYIPKLTVIDLSENQLTGSIPSEFGNLVNLKALSLAGSGLSGSIPESLGQITTLERLNLSANFLTGKIPYSVAQINYTVFDVRVNLLGGEIPDTPVMRNFSPAAFLPGNTGLCGDVIAKVCPSGLSKLAKILIGSIIPGTFISTILLLAYCFIYPHQEFSPKEIRRITDNFNNTHLIGVGILSTVYRGVYPDGRVLAVKRLRPDYYSIGRRDFDAERLLLKKLDHPNIVKVKGSCCCGRFMTLIMEYIPNGSLDMQLGNMNWRQRLNVGGGVAQAIAYLHGEWHADHIMHCDLKSTSIVLDEELKPLLTDVRLATSRSPFVTNTNRAMIYSGAFGGYTPPEYAVSGVGTAAGDVYSFGVLLLELLTGTKPDSVAMVDGGLPGWVQRAFPNRLRNVLDPKLLHSVGCSDQVVYCFKIALQCTDITPTERPNMLEVLNMFEVAYSIV